MDGWMLLCVLAICDTYLYSIGHDTFLWKHKTPAEKDIQAAKIAEEQFEFIGWYSEDTGAIYANEGNGMVKAYVKKGGGEQ